MKQKIHEHTHSTVFKKSSYLSSLTTTVITTSVKVTTIQYMCTCIMTKTNVVITNTRQTIHLRERSLGEGTNLIIINEKRNK